MKFVDVSGAPGCGKSTLCYPIWGDKSVIWDGLPPPASWKPFLDEMTRLMFLVDDHPTFEAVLRMNDRSLKKMSAVYRMRPLPDKPVFLQTGWLQRITGFGWRLEHMGRDINLIRQALWLMPVSVGVAFLEADLETILHRNREREKVKATAHENRSEQAKLMLNSIELAKNVMKKRGVNTVEIDVQHQSIESARQELLDFAHQKFGDAQPDGSCGEVALFSSPPIWFRS